MSTKQKDVSRDMKKMKLRKDNDDPDWYIDQNGVSWKSPYDWLWSGILEACGCGSSDELSKIAFKVLQLFSLPHEERKWSVYDKQKYEILAHWLDSKGLLEHGSSVAGSWLTELGEDVYNNIYELTKQKE